MQLQFTVRHFRDLSLMELHDLLWLRNEVFVVGQRITCEPEVDGHDPECTHVLGATPEGRVVATARLFLDREPVKVGRIAVARDLQGQGLGVGLMAAVHDAMGDRAGYMSAQAYLERWYGSLGWQRVGELYEEAEIPHIAMVRPRPSERGAS